MRVDAALANAWTGVTLITYCSRSFTLPTTEALSITPLHRTASPSLRMEQALSTNTTAPPLRSTARTDSRFLVRFGTSMVSSSTMRVLVFPLPTSMKTWPGPLMGTLSPLAKVTSAPLPAVRTVKPLSLAAMWLVAPESST